VPDPEHPLDLLRPRRRITGISAVLLPFHGGAVDWPSFEAHVARTAEAGLTPAVNMDTGYVHLLDDDTRAEVLDRAAKVVDGGPLVAGAQVDDTPGTAWRPDPHLRRMEAVQERGAIPVVFPSHALTELDGAGIVDAHRELAAGSDRFIAFELSPVFAPAGRIFDLDTYRGLLTIDQCIGAKHSSLQRQPEWDRLRLRDRVRPDFHVFTGNDLAIDMVMYGSDYLLGLSTMAPDLFARRDALWEEGDAGFYELNDLLQHLGHLTFRPPVPAYKHSAAQWLHLRGWLASDETAPGAPRRPDSDREILAAIGRALGVVE